MADYPPPLDRLLSLGADWVIDDDNFRALGLGPEHVPDLIRLATDPALLRPEPPAEDEDYGAEAWAPYHAWEILGRLRAEAAIGPLLDLLVRAEEDDPEAEFELIPDVLGEIGPAAMPALTAILADAARSLWTRAAASTGLLEMARRHPETRDECVALIAGQLEAFPDNGDELNGFLIGDLLGLKAVEAAPVMERAFAAGAVDESIVGDWPLARYELGLGEMPPPRRFQPYPPLNLGSPAPRAGHVGQVEHRKERNKARKKLEKKSRKQSRNKRGRR